MAAGRGARMGMERDSPSETHTADLGQALRLAAKLECLCLDCCARSGVAFPVSELGTVQLWSDRSPRAYAALLPRHVRQRAQHEGVASIRPYVVAFPEGSDPQPFELAEIITQRHPGVRIEKLGVL